MIDRMTDQDVFDPSARRMSAAELRQNNERAVLTAIATQGGSSAAEIARRTHLAPQSVARMLGDLERVGLIVRGEARKGLRGQPAVPIYLNPDGVFTIGCELGWQHYRIVLRNLAGEVLGEHSRHYAFPAADVIFGEIGSLVRILTTLVPEEVRDRLIGIGLAMPTNIFRNLDLLGAPKAEVAKWKDLDVAAALSQATGLEVFPFNDGNAACWGELVAMGAPRPKNITYFLISTFVGAGVIADGKLWEGARGNAANMGGMLIAGDDGKPTFVHLVASIHAFEERLTKAGMAIPPGMPESWNWDAFAPQAEEWLDAAARAISIAIINAHAMLESDLAIVDSALPDPIRERLVIKVRERLANKPTLTSEHPPVLQGNLGGRAPALGAALMPMYRRYFSRDAADMGL